MKIQLIFQFDFLSHDSRRFFLGICQTTQAYYRYE